MDFVLGVFGLPILCAVLVVGAVRYRKARARVTRLIQPGEAATDSDRLPCYMDETNTQRCPEGECESVRGTCWRCGYPAQEQLTED